MFCDVCWCSNNQHAHASTPVKMTYVYSVYMITYTYTQYIHTYVPGCVHNSMLAHSYTITYMYTRLHVCTYVNVYTHTHAHRYLHINEPHQALAREIENMRMKLQSMGLCVGGTGDPHRAPTPSSTPVPAQSPAQPPAQPRRPQHQHHQQHQQASDRAPDAAPNAHTKQAQPDKQLRPLQEGQRQQQKAHAADKLLGHGNAPHKPLESPAHRHNVQGANSAASAPAPKETVSTANPDASTPSTHADTAAKDAAQQSPQSAQQPSLFAKMRTAGAVKAAERADGGISSNAGAVYRCPSYVKRVFVCG
jgi:hypothetical protein